MKPSVKTLGGALYTPNYPKSLKLLPKKPDALLKRKRRIDRPGG